MFKKWILMLSLENIQNKNFIVYSLTNFKITGSVINMLDYLTFAIDNSIEVYCIFITDSAHDCLDGILNDRYNILYKKNILILDKQKARRLFFKLRANILFFISDFEIQETIYCSLANKKILLGPCDKKIPSSVLVLNEFGEEKNYIFKMNFDKIDKKENVNSQDKVYLNLICKTPDLSESDFVKYCLRDNLLVHIKEGTHGYLSNYNVQVLTGVVPSLFSKFSTYLYFKMPSWFDRSPRLFIEAKFLNKKIEYINVQTTKDNSTTRYLDDDVESHRLTLDDYVIRCFTNEENIGNPRIP